jgi:hypothetical protein
MIARITIEAIGGKLNRDTDPPKPKGEKPWPHFAWNCTLTYEGRTLDVSNYRAGLAHCTRRYSVGGWPRKGEVPETPSNPGHGGGSDWMLKPTPPSAFDVLYCVVMDAQCYENARDLEDFCADMGYDPDSRKAEAMYKACDEESKRLRQWLGTALFATVLAFDEDELRAWAEGTDAPTAAPDAGQVQA